MKLLPFPWLSRLLLAVSATPLNQIPLGHHQQSAALSPSSDPAAPSYRDALLSLHKSLVSIPSVTGTENAVGQFLVEYLTSRGYVAQLQFLPPQPNTPDGAERFNVLAWPGTRRHPHPKVVVSSHIDVVPPYIPYSVDTHGQPHIDGETLIRGRGSVDAKASVAAQIIAVQELLASGAIHDDEVMLLYVVGEETTGDGMRFFSDSLSRLDPPPRFQAAIFGEPTENKLACGHKGHAACTITAKGKAGHSGYPWLGKSANEMLIRALVRILDADLGSSERFGNTTVNVGTMAGGVAANVIPADARARIAARIAAGEQGTGYEIVRTGVQRILEETDAEALSMECDNGYGPVRCECDVNGFETFIANYGTDAPNLKGDHERYLYGPGTIFVAHGDDEGLTVRELEESVEGFKTLLKHALRERE